jgi:hypothetical protein
MNTITQRLTRKTINDRRFLGNTLIEIENTEETEKQPMKKNYYRIRLQNKW